MQQLASRASSVLHPQPQSQQANTSTSGSVESSDDRRQWRQKHSLLTSQDEAAVSQAVSLATKQQESALQVRQTPLRVRHVLQKHPPKALL